VLTQVTAYKNGHQPEEQDTYDANAVAAAEAAASAAAEAQRARAKGLATAAKDMAAAGKDMAATGKEEFQVLNKRKRDLRSIEQVCVKHVGACWSLLRGPMLLAACCGLCSLVVQLLCCCHPPSF
jgi:hypothetical protein